MNAPEKSNQMLPAINANQVEKKIEHVGMEPRGNKAPPHLEIGLVLCNRLRVEELLSSGGFGQVFKAIDQNNNKVYAIKVEPRDREAARMILEQRVLNLLRKTKHTPKLIASGNYQNFMFLAMEMLGRNLNDLRCRRLSRHFTLGTSLRIAIQMLEALEDIHKISYLHRDVKPCNMCIGIGDSKRTIYLVDFGMTRRFRDENGQFRKSRKYAGFRGTLRYVSLTVHERKDQGPADDLWSLLYSVIELCESRLPWKSLKQDEEIAQMKTRTSIESMVTNLPKSIKEISDHLATLAYDSIPDYALVKKVYSDAMPNDVTAETLFDWEAMSVASNGLELESESNH